MVYLYYIIGALLRSIKKSPCVSWTFSLKDLLPTGFRGVFRRLLGHQRLDLGRLSNRKCNHDVDARAVDNDVEGLGQIVGSLLANASPLDLAIWST